MKWFKHGAILYNEAEVFSLSIPNPIGWPVLPCLAFSLRSIFLRKFYVVQPLFGFHYHTKKPTKCFKGGLPLPLVGSLHVEESKFCKCYSHVKSPKQWWWWLFSSSSEIQVSMLESNLSDQVQALGGFIWVCSCGRTLNSHNTFSTLVLWCEVYMK